MLRIRFAKAAAVTALALGSVVLIPTAAVAASSPAVGTVSAQADATTTPVAVTPDSSVLGWQ